MQHPTFDLPRLAIIPEILSQISASSAGHIHSAAIPIMALWALPFHIIIDTNLTIKTTDMADIRFGIKLRI